MIICGIVGWKNSGKTFIVQKLIQYFIEQKSFDLHWKIHDRSLFYDHFKLFIRK